jgi:Flp pilus assembly protein CpaB
MTYRVKNIGIAVMLAALAGLLTIFYVANYKRHVQHGQKTVSVLVAARDIPAGTSGSEVVGQHYLTSETIVHRSVVPGAISSSNQLQNLVVTQQINRGEQVTTRRFGTTTQLGIRAQLKGSERAIQLEGSSNELLAGTLKLGDHVDVIANWGYPSEAGPHYSKVIVRDLLVLRAPAGPDAAKVGASDSGVSVQLRATDRQMQKVYWARKNGVLSLLLRPPADAQNSPRSVDNTRSLFLTR